MALNVLTPGFSSDLIGIFTEFDLMPSLFSLFCPCIVLGSARAKVDGRDCGILDCCCLANPIYQVRAAVRKGGSPTDKVFDCLLASILADCCVCCAAHQTAKEAGADIIPPKDAFMRL
eukprot:m.352908 g.352908  ORF g.352908 m.352908 type:complete len:118 (+) comp16641_c0_seq1:307-660(+)